ncbi:type II secretion system inner membrane protein GspF [bacterium]|nr:type II secretion system inner membrane protein GspF [candidate division CSSED10-310 bacterium]
MPVFTYKASDIKGLIIDGTMEGKDEGAIISRLQEQQLFPLLIKPVVEAKGISREVSIKSFMKRTRKRDIMVFTQQLATLLDAGMQLDRALAILIELNEGTKLQEAIMKIRKNVQGGSSFADALAKHPKLFSRLYVNMVRSGESGGVLEIIMARLAGFLEMTQTMRDEIISAMIYPILLSSVGGAALIILLTFVLPKFTVIFADLGVAMPLVTRLVLSFSNFIKHYWYLILGALVFGFLALRSYRKTEKGRIGWDGFILKIPLLGELMQKIEIARFSRTLGTLSRSGVPILQALSIVKDTLTNEVIANALIDVYGSLKEGDTISGPLRDAKVFPPLAIHMIAVGEETGKLENMLLKIADVYETDVKVTIKRLMSLLEPAMILIMGVVVGFIVVSMLMAIFSISSFSF